MSVFEKFRDRNHWRQVMQSPGKLTAGAFFGSADDGLSALPMLVESDAVVIVYGFRGAGIKPIPRRRH